MSIVTYNERSWAIDIISEINAYSSGIDRLIKRAGGESTINTGRRVFFPDVLLFGKNSDILMGWELKMPDTPLTDTDLIHNAIEKANILRLNGFLLWNVQGAVLYIKEDEDFNPIKSWDTSHGVINSRRDVEGNRARWIESLHEILDDLNNLFERGTIVRRPLIESFRDDSIITFILASKESTARALKNATSTDAKFRAESNLWWRVSQHEYPGHDKWNILAEIILVNWINKVLFANILTAFYTNATKVYDIVSGVTQEDAIRIFEEISSTCDFWNIFQPQLGEKYITQDSWNEIVELNSLLRDFELSSVGQELLQGILENVIYTAKRKVAGQFTTPMKLARLLVRLTMLDSTGTLHDPCCGTGTIPRAAYDIKKADGISAEDALSSIFASDKVSFPLQMATLAISEPQNIGNIIQIFKQDVTDIIIGQNLELRDPYDGSIVTRIYPSMLNITSNLPFIRQEDLRFLNPNVQERTNFFIREQTGQNIKLAKKSDLYAYIPFYLWGLLEDNGRIGIIVSNSWVGTEWGTVFRKALSYFFKIECVITSAQGRWFQNADVVSNIIILEKRNTVGEPEGYETTKFITLNEDINELDNNSIEELFDEILLEQESTKFNIQTYNTRNIINISLNWNSLFCDISWLSNIENQLIDCKDLFEINRGERRGWNPMFYPDRGHGIEADFIRPVLKTSKNIQTLIASAETDAFCCSESITNLTTAGKSGAIRWINRFENEVNGNGEALPEVLHREGVHWYEMNDSTLADLVASINFNNRLFIAKMDERSFVDQRLTRFTALNDNVDVDLAHALMNSIIGIFYIEAIGFGRGLGALDLSSARMKNSLKMLNPDLLTEAQINSIKEKFEVVRDRDILNILDELEQEDRIAFDDEVLDAFNILESKENIINSFKFLYEMRKTVNN